jgi:hypothetical protein
MTGGKPDPKAHECRRCSARVIRDSAAQTSEKRATARSSASRMNPVRNHDREHTFLAAAARGHAPFVAHAQARLEAGDEPFGDSWAWIGIGRHLSELLEEAADLGAWAALADEALDLERLTDRQRQQVRAVLALAARRGAEAHQSLTAALRSIETQTTTEAQA